MWLSQGSSVLSELAGACHHRVTQGRDSMRICRMQRGLEGGIRDSVCKVPSTEAEAQGPGLGAESQGAKLMPTLSCCRLGPIQGSGIEPTSGVKGP